MKALPLMASLFAFAHPLKLASSMLTPISAPDLTRILRPRKKSVLFSIRQMEK
jgi:hypothetical protein